MRQGARIFASSAALIAACLAAPAAHADNVADAEDLFRRAKALMTANKAADACPLFKESYRLDPAQGTLLNLALCNEAVGKIGTAWGQFRAVEQQARRATPPRTDRIDLSKGHADKLEPRISRVRIVVPPAAKAPGLVVKVDGEVKGEPLWGSGIVVDPGSHAIEATATKKKSVSVIVDIKGEGTTKDFELKPLEDAPPDAPAPSKPVGVVNAILAEPDYASARSQKTAGFIAIGAGAAVLAAGGVFGVLAITKSSSAKDCNPCVAGSSQAVDSNRATDNALLFANVANVAIPVGLVAAAVGTYFVLTAGPTEKVAIVPRITTRSASIDMVVRGW